MNREPRQATDYEPRQVAAARRVLVDLGQVLAAYRRQIVVVGGWVPDLVFPEAEPEHVGSIDVDLALNTRELSDGQYAKVIESLVISGRYSQGTLPFQLVAEVDLQDGERPVRVDIDFLAPDWKLKKNKPKLLEGFRVLQFPACAAAFRNPVSIEFSGQMVSGAQNHVEMMVASTADFLIMKAHALALRDKPKDAYDICHCLDNYPGGMAALSTDWAERKDDVLVVASIVHLRSKFASIEHFGPQALAEFHGYTDDSERALHARRGYELVQEFLRQMGEA